MKTLIFYIVLFICNPIYAQDSTRKSKSFHIGDTLSSLIIYPVCNPKDEDYNYKFAISKVFKPFIEKHDTFGYTFLFHSDSRMPENWATKQADKFCKILRDSCSSDSDIECLGMGSKRLKNHCKTYTGTYSEIIKLIDTNKISKGYFTYFDSVKCKDLVLFDREAKLRTDVLKYKIICTVSEHQENRRYECVLRKKKNK